MGIIEKSVREGGSYLLKTGKVIFHVYLVSNYSDKWQFRERAEKV